MDEDLNQIMDVLVREVAKLVDEGYSVRQATDMVADAVYEQFPTIAAAMVLAGADR